MALWLTAGPRESMGKSADTLVSPIARSRHVNRRMYDRKVLRERIQDTSKGSIVNKRIETRISTCERTLRMICNNRHVREVDNLKMTYVHALVVSIRNFVDSKSVPDYHLISNVANLVFAKRSANVSAASETGCRFSGDNFKLPEAVKFSRRS